MAQLQAITTSFMVDGQWYDMPYYLVRRIEDKLGDKPTNRAIVEYVMSRKHCFAFGKEGEVITIDLQWSEANGH